MVKDWTSEEGRKEQYETLPPNTYEWRYENCDQHVPNTSGDYMVFIKHGKGHKIGLCEIETGEIVARNLNDAKARGRHAFPPTPREKVGPYFPQASLGRGAPEISPRFPRVLSGGGNPGRGKTRQYYE